MLCTLSVYFIEGYLIRETYEFLFKIGFFVMMNTIFFHFIIIRSLQMINFITIKNEC